MKRQNSRDYNATMCMCNGSIEKVKGQRNEGSSHLMPHWNYLNLKSICQMELILIVFNQVSQKTWKLSTSANSQKVIIWF